VPSSKGVSTGPIMTAFLREITINTLIHRAEQPRDGANSKDKNWVDGKPCHDIIADR
jgi:hypothetical protein